MENELLDLFEKLIDQPDDKALAAKVNEAAQAHGDAAPEADVGVRPEKWANVIGRQQCQPAYIEYPTTLQDLLGYVALAKQKSLTVRAVGSGHSFSNICPTDGILVNPKRMKAVLPLDPSTLKDPSQKASLFMVESGITIEALNEALDAQHVALANMGAYDGQTISGAISTGTHGTGMKLGPIASSVRALTLVTEEGKVYQIEPSNGISDPSKFPLGPNNIILQQDDAWFNTTLVAMGCTGLIYSYIIETVPAFYLQEFRTLDTWQNLRDGLRAGANSAVLQQNDGYEIDLNPYPIAGVNTAIQIRHNRIDRTQSSGTRGLKNFFAGILAKFALAREALLVLLNLFPAKTPQMLTSALEVLITPPKEVDGYVDKSFDVMNIGPTNQVPAYALELSIPCDEHLVDNIEKLLALMQKIAAQPPSTRAYLSGPVALRFVAASNAFLAPQAGRATCMVELDTMLGIKTADRLLQAIKEGMCAPGNGIRVHWGLNPEDSLTADDVKSMYGTNLDQWLGVYRQLNSSGMWNNKFTDLIGISQPRG